MHSPQANKGSEDQFGLLPIDGLESFLTDTNNSFHFGEESANMNVNADSNEPTFKLNARLAQTPELGCDTDLPGGVMFENMNPTTIAAPPPSQSNLGTPKDQFGFSLSEFAPALTRIFSEQSGLASLNPEDSDHPGNVHQILVKNQQQKLHASSTPMSRTESYGWAQDAGSVISSANSRLPAPAMSYPQHHAEPGHSLQPGFGARHSHSRTPLRPSGLSSALPFQLADPFLSISEVAEPNPQFMQAYAHTSTAQQPAYGYRNRRHTDTQLFPRNQLVTPLPNFDPSPMFEDFMGNHANYSGPAQDHSREHQARPVYHSQGMHGKFVHSNSDSHQQMHGVLLQQPPIFPPYIVRPHQQSPFGQRMHTTMKLEGSPSEAYQQRASSQSMGETRVTRDVQSHDPQETSSAPITAEENETYFKKILAAMYDTSRAQDNAGMISTWKTQMNDKEAVEGIARDLLEVCKKREALGRPFRKGLKPSQRFQTFRDHFEALIEALTTQKTMCKHLLRQPYIEEIVDDPLGSIARITNNRKVNKGKKLAIEKGREALGQEGKSRRSAKISSHGETDEDEQDAEYESFDETAYETVLKRPSSTLHQSGSPDNDSRDPDHGEGSASKRPKRASRSKYQLNENNEMIDTSESRAGHSTFHLRNEDDTLDTPTRPNNGRRLQHQSSYSMSHNRQGYESTSPSDISYPPTSNPRFSQAENAGNQGSGYRPASASRPRRSTRH